METGLWLRRGARYGGRNCLLASNEEIQKFCDEVHSRIIDADRTDYFFDARDSDLKIIRESTRDYMDLGYR